VRDSLGHGTHVAGIASAETNNSTGVAGVAGSCRLLICQVFDAYGSGYWSWFKNAVIYAVDSGANVINFSGGGGASQEGYDAVAYAYSHNVSIVVAAGNYHAWYNPDTLVQYPAKYSLNFPNVIAVGATDHNDNRSWYSGRGSALNVAAPGGYGYQSDANDIYSTTPNYPFNLGEWYGITQNYGYMAGTSMAAPHVSGIVGLILSVNPNLTPAEVRSIIQQTADDKGPANFDTLYGYGRVNAYRALLPVIAPANFQNTAQQNQWVNVSWTATGNPILQYYEIERKIDSGAWTVIGTTTDTSFVDVEFKVKNQQGTKTASYKVRQYSTNGVYSNYSSIVTVEGMYYPTKKGIAGVTLPSEYRMAQNYPNPFNPTTVINYQLPATSHICMKVYDILGREVTLLADGMKVAGYYSMTFNGAGLASGVYYVRFTATPQDGNKPFMQLHKLIITK